MKRKRISYSVRIRADDERNVEYPGYRIFEVNSQ